VEEVEKVTDMGTAAIFTYTGKEDNMKKAPWKYF